MLGPWLLYGPMLFRTWKEPLISDIYKLILGLSVSAVRLDKLDDDKDENKLDFDSKIRCVLLS